MLCRSPGRYLLAFASILAVSAPAAADEPAPALDKVRADAIDAINRRIADGWQAEGLMPAGRCSDHAFLRRASLDVIGRIPTLDEIDRYLRDPAAQRRRLLVERLLSSPEYPANWARLWTDWLLTRDCPEQYRAPLRRWLETEVLAREDVSYKDMVERILTARGKLDDNGAVAFTLAYLGGSASQQLSPPDEGCGDVSTHPIAVPDRDPDATVGERATRLARVGQFDARPLTAQTVQKFLGQRIACCQCHDHPFNPEWKQKDFWGVNAFLRQIERRGRPGRPDLEIRDNPELHRQALIYFERRNGAIVVTGPRFLDGRRMPANVANRRAILTGFVTSHPNFAPTAVNRLWAHFFGWSMNQAARPDDFGEHNEVVHAELLEELSGRFAGPAGYRPRELIRWICNSEPYQLKAQANAGNQDDEKDVFLSRYLQKAPDPDTMREALVVALFQRSGGDGEQRFRRVWEQELGLDRKGGDEGLTMPSLPDALALMNNPRLNRLLHASGGTLKRAKKEITTRAAIDVLFLAVLTRPATAAEHRKLSRKLGVEKSQAPPPEVMEDLLWALINCNEFYLGH